MRKRKDAPSRREFLAILHGLEAQIAEQAEQIERQAQRIRELEAELAKARKNSSTSSKPPSSDIVKPPRPGGAGGGKRKIGGQPGHRKHERPPFPPEAVNQSWIYTPDACPICAGHGVPTDDPPRCVQQVDLVASPLWITEHLCPVHKCVDCGQLFYAPLPPAVEKAGLVGPHLTALVAYLKGVCHASFSTIHKFLRDVLGVSISRGQLSKLVTRKVSAALRDPYEELLRRLPTESRLNVDETGHKEHKRRMWTWCFRAEDYTVLRIAGTRGSQVLWDVLGQEFQGVLGCDYFSAYRKYMKDASVLVQFCLAHLIRDLKFLTTLPDAATAAYGQDVLDAVRELFHANPAGFESFIGVSE